MLLVVTRRGENFDENYCDTVAVVLRQVLMLLYRLLWDAERTTCGTCSLEDVGAESEGLSTASPRRDEQEIKVDT